MALTQEQWLEQIKLEIDEEDNSNLDSSLPLWWEMFSAKSTDYIRYLHVKKKAISLVRAQAKKAIDRQVGMDRTSANQRFKNLSEMFDEVEQEISQLDASSVKGAAKLKAIEPTSDMTGVTVPREGFGIHSLNGDRPPYETDPIITGKDLF